MEDVRVTLFSFSLTLKDCNKLNFSTDLFLMQLWAGVPELYVLNCLWFSEMSRGNLLWELCTILQGFYLWKVINICVQNRGRDKTTRQTGDAYLMPLNKVSQSLSLNWCPPTSMRCTNAPKDIEATVWSVFLAQSNSKLKSGGSMKHTSYTHKKKGKNFDCIVIFKN